MFSRTTVGLIIIAAVVLLTAGSSVAQTSAPAKDSSTDVWKDWQFLIGEWVGDDNGKPGMGEGSFTFAPDLGGTVLVRRSSTSFPATDKRPAFTHLDLLTVYFDPSGAAKGFYVDNEGHTINYTATLSADKSILTFVSDSMPQMPRFRLSYAKIAEGKVKVAFEIAPPGQPEAFQPYLSGTAHRK